MFDIQSSKKIFHGNQVNILEDKQKDAYPYVVRQTKNNGIRGYLVEDNQYLNPKNTLSFAQDTFTVYYQEEAYFTGNKVKILVPKLNYSTKKTMIFITACFQKSLEKMTWGTGSTVDTINSIKIELPLNYYSEIDFMFIEEIVAELEALRVAELEAYLKVTGLKDYNLTKEEEKALERFNSINWKSFNLEKLFGKSTRGRRLKSDDRIPGNLPFVTAGETDEGVSDFIGNNVVIFNENTTTIDMFGSSKYRNYKYGGDDHIAVVHTEALEKYSAIFVTSAIHKSSHNGQFSYDKNFYAKDADVLNIMLPEKSGEPDYDFMKNLISAIHKLVIKDVVDYADKKISVTKLIIN